MTHITGEIVINRPVVEVFDCVADQRNEPRYNPQMVAAEKVTDGPVGRGTQFRATVLERSRPVEMLITITDYDRPHRLVSHTTLTAMDIDGVLTFDAVPAGTLLQWSWEVHPHGMLTFLNPLVNWIGRRQEQRIWRGLKRYVESRHTPEVHP